MLNGIKSYYKPSSSNIKSWDLSNNATSYYTCGWGDVRNGEAATGCGTTESLETFANQSQYKMKVFTDNSNVKHLIPNWITDEVANKIF